MKNRSQRRRRLTVLLCALLLFGSAFPIAAYADNATITSGYLYSYFQTFGSNGQWKDIQTPSHWVTDTQQVAYCLQTERESPYNAAYSTIDGSAVYNNTVINGLQAILKNGYPANTGGWADDQARYATANAIRFWLAENGCDGVPGYLNLKANGQWIRGRPGYEELYDWALWLVGLARSGSASSAGSLTFSPSTLNLTEDGDYFVGSATLNKNISDSTYGLYGNLPTYDYMTGFTGTKSERLSFKIPVDYEQQTYTLTAYGSDSSNTAKLFFWAPSAYNQQRIVTYVLDTSSTWVEGTLTIKTPKATPRKSNITITKTNAETGAALAGVTFALYNEAGTEVTRGTTGADGKVTFLDVLIGKYSYAEIAAPPNFVLDSTRRAITLTQGGITYNYSESNTPIRGDLKITKVDAYEEDIKLMGTGFRLLDADGNVLDEGYTGADGTLTFPNLLYGNYSYQEFWAPKGFLLDETVYPVSITQHGVTVSNTSRDPRRPGTLQVKKQTADGSPLAGAAFCLEYSLDNGSTWAPVTHREDGPEVTRGGCTSPGLAEGQLVTDAGGIATFTGLRADSLILYRLTETAAPEGMSLIGGSLYVGTLPVETDNIYAEDSEVFDSKAFCYTLYVTATDDPVFRLPETGGASLVYMPLAMTLMASPAIITTNLKRRKTT